MRTGIFVLVVLCACSNKLSSDLEINGKKVKISSCRNGSVYGYRGVEITADDGTRLRITSTVTGEAELIIIASGADSGASLGKCGSFKVSDQRSTINDVKNVEGKATLDCSGQGVTIKGKVSFENCH